MSSTTQIGNGFFNVSFGQGPDKVYGIAVCRGDHSPEVCHRYLRDGTGLLHASCPVQKEATGYYYGYIMFRYSNRPILEIRNNSDTCGGSEIPSDYPEIPLDFPYPVVQKYKQTLSNLLERVKRNASTGNSRYKFSSGEEDINDSLKVYAMAQCNPYLSSSDCLNCLEEVTIGLEHCCSNLTGGGLYGPICDIEYRNFTFLNTVTYTSLQPSPPTPEVDHAKAGNRRRIAYKALITIIGLASCLLIATLIYVLLRRNQRQNRKEQGYYDQMRLEDSLQLDLNIIQVATDNFSDSARLNNGSATVIYKGVLPDGQEIAVMKLHRGDRGSELQVDNEVVLSTHLQHKNLVKLLGFCIENDFQFLVYEYLPNGSLRDYLKDRLKRTKLDWQRRFNVISGFSRGLLYLHEDSQVRVIHRNLKPGNILLGAQMDAKISNFKSAIMVDAHQTTGDTKVVGTYGYMPEEYVQSRHSSIKSDIFSYGVILLEIITGCIIVDFSGDAGKNLLAYVWRKWCEGTFMDVVDQVLSNTEKQKHIDQIQRCIKIALLCVQEDPRNRPSTSVVALMLNSDTINIAEPTRPGLLIINNVDLYSKGHASCSEKSYETSLNEDSISYLDPR